MSLPAGLNGHYFGLFALGKFIDLADEGVGELLDVVKASAFIVFRYELVLCEFLKSVVGRMTGIADRDAMFFGDLVYLFCKLFAAFFIERRNRKADHLSVVGRIKP